MRTRKNRPPLMFGDKSLQSWTNCRQKLTKLRQVKYGKRYAKLRRPKMYHSSISLLGVIIKKSVRFFWGNPLPHVRCGYIQTRNTNPEVLTLRIYLTHHTLTQESIRLLANLARLRTLRLTAQRTGIVDDAPLLETGIQPPSMPDGVTIFLTIMLMTPTLKIYRKV